MGQTQRETATDTYTIRQFEPGDFEGYQSLFESVWGGRPRREWFEWKYGEDNPFYDVSIVLAETNGEVIGAKPHVPIRLRAGDDTPLAVVATDTMVREDHRHRGLFSHMVKDSLERYADREPAFVFNYPNENTRRAYRKRGWYVLGNRNTSAYRIQDPEPFVRHHGGPAGAVGGPVAGAVVRLAERLLDGVRDSADEVVVTKNPPNAPAALGAIPRPTEDIRLHVERDETFFRWWLNEPAPDEETPENDRTTYVAYRRGDPVAGAVVDTVELADSAIEGFDRRTEILDVVPPAPEGRSDAVVRVLERVLEDAHASQVVKAPKNALSPVERRALGFVDGGLPYLSRFTVSPQPGLALRPLGEQFTVNGAVVTDPEDWLVTNAEVDPLS